MPSYFGARRALVNIGGAGPSGIFNIALASGDSSAGLATNLLSAATNYPRLLLNITQYTSSTLPAVTAGQFDAILFWSNGTLTWNSSFDTFNNANGGLVTGQFYGSTGITSITSTIMPTVSGTGGQSGGAITWPVGPYTTPIANGYNGTTQQVKPFTTFTYAATSPTLNAGATTVVTSTGGATLPFVIVKDNTAPTGRTVFFNAYPLDGSDPNFSLLMLNSLLWAARKI
jgi:hypothetical protein